MVSLFISETVLCLPGGPGFETLVAVLLFGFSLLWSRVNRSGPWFENQYLSLAVTVIASLCAGLVSLFGLLLTGLFDDLLGRPSFGCGIQTQYLPAVALSVLGTVLLLRVWWRLRQST
jgi:hypothetical protein